MKVSFTVNGHLHHLDLSPNEVLLDVLRDKLGIKSPKIGCERGDCGTCTVLLDGRSVRSCLMLAVEADGCNIVTVEGVGAKGPTDLQKSFLKHNSFQCGFCAPGVVLTATELLKKNPHPSEEEVKEHLSGNLCRCTGYEPIIDAVLDASRKNR